MNETTERGIVYVAAGEEFVEEARISAESATAVMPDVPITLFTDVDADAGEVFDEVREMNDPRYDGGDRVFHADRTPYERTLFLDTDIYFDDPVDEIFDLLERFDVAACINQFRHQSQKIDLPKINALPDSFPEYNGGLLAWRRNDRTDAFLQLWAETFREVTKHGQIHNQAALRYALYHTDVSIGTMPGEYNCVFRRRGSVARPVKVFHGRLLDIDSYGASQEANLEQAIAELNRKDGLRIYYRVVDEVKIIEYTLPDRIRHSIHKRGVVGTIKRIPRYLRKHVPGE